MPCVLPADIDQAGAFSGPGRTLGSLRPQPLRRSLTSVCSIRYHKGIGYGYQMGLPTADIIRNPDVAIGLAAYFLHHDARSYELISRVLQRQAEGSRVTISSTTSRSPV